MYQANGIDLSSSQYKELLALHALSGSQQDVEYAYKRLHPGGNKYVFDDIDAAKTYLGLYELGLIKGYKVNGFANYKGLAQHGIDFIEDHRKLSDEREQEKKRDRRSSIVGAISGAVAGAVVTGIFQIVLMLVA